MLRQSQIDRIRSKFKKAHDLLAGDTITHVDFNTGVSTDLLCIFADLDQESFKGVQIDPSGVIANSIYEVQFENSYLEDMEVTISEEDYFWKDNKKLVFAKSEQLKRNIVPIAGIHNFTVIRLIDSTQFNQETPVGDSGWNIV